MVGLNMCGNLKSMMDKTLDELDPGEQISMKCSSKYNNFHSIKCISENILCQALWNGGHFV